MGNCFNSQSSTSTHEKLMYFGLDMQRKSASMDTVGQCSKYRSQEKKTRTWVCTGAELGFEWPGRALFEQDPFAV
jgi:hypothetical protein